MIKKSFFIILFLFIIFLISSIINDYAYFFWNKDVYLHYSGKYLKLIKFIEDEKDILDWKLSNIYKNTVSIIFYIKKNNKNKKIILDFDIKNKNLLSIYFISGFILGKDKITLYEAKNKIIKYINLLWKNVDLKQYNFNSKMVMNNNREEFFFSWKKVYKGYEVWINNEVSGIIYSNNELNFISYNDNFIECDIPNDVITKEKALNYAQKYLLKIKNRKFTLDQTIKKRTDFFLMNINRPIIISNYSGYINKFSGHKLVWVLTGHDEKQDSFVIFINAENGEMVGGKNI
ncbi:MAG: hypothetical protein M0Q02_13470 [Candidatus Muirbacterium halophilum]|nr:hypothetical protein [Candidatus Muirbacterium halophilum]